MYKINKIAKESKTVHTVTKIASIIVYLILIPIILFNLILIIKSFINPKETPSLFGIKNFVIVSGSMEPTIHIGDAILVKEVPQEEIQINDIISFQDGETITTHRVIGIEEKNGIKRYRTKGDNNNVEDKGSITYHQIEGKYQFKIEGFGFITKLVQNKFVLLLLLVLVILSIIVSIKRNNKKQERKEKRMRQRENP